MFQPLKVKSINKFFFIFKKFFFCKNYLLIFKLINKKYLLIKWFLFNGCIQQQKFFKYLLAKLFKTTKIYLLTKKFFFNKFYRIMNLKTMNNLYKLILNKKKIFHFKWNYLNYFFIKKIIKKNKKKTKKLKKIYKFKIFILKFNQIYLKLLNFKPTVYKKVNYNKILFLLNMKNKILIQNKKKKLLIKNKKNILKKNLKKYKTIKLIYKLIKKKKKKIYFFKAYFIRWLYLTKVKFYNIARFNENMFDMCFITILCFRGLCSLALFGRLIKIIFKRQRFHLNNWHKLEYLFYSLYLYLKKYKLNKLVGLKWQLKGRLKGKLRMNIWSKILHTVKLVKYSNSIDFQSVPIITKAGLATLRIWLNKTSSLYTFLNLYSWKKNESIKKT